MSKYVLNKRKQDSESGNNFEVHNEETCQRLPDYENRINLDNHYDCHSAVAKAKEKYPKNAKDIDGCYWCSSDCHIE